VSISDYAENKLLDAVVNATTTGGGLPTADPWIQLYSADPGETGASNQISHTRIQVAFPSAASGTVANSSNVDVTSMPAATVVAWALFDAVTTGNCLWTGWFSTVAGTAQVDAGTDVTNNDIESSAHGLTTDDRVVFEVLEAFTLPAGLTAGTLYFVLATGLATDSFRVSTTSGGSAVDITAGGQGMWRKVVPKTTNSGDTFRVSASALNLFID